MDKSTRDEENGFLLEVCVSGMGQASEASHPPPSLDWDYLIHFLDMHYLSGMARRHLMRGGAWDRIPPQAQARLTATYANVTASTLLSVQWLEQLVHEANRRGIAIVLLKGMRSCLDLYSDPGLRAFRDIDILVRPEQVDAAGELLSDTGLLLEGGQSLSKLTKLYNHATFLPARHGERGTCPLEVELHWAFHEFDSSAHFDTDRLWECVVPIRVGSAEAQALCNEDEAIHIAHHICRHAFFHSYARLIWFCDLAIRLTAGGPAISVDGFAARNAAYNSWPDTAMAVGMLERLFHFELPADVRETIRRRSSRLVEAMAGRIEVDHLLEGRFVMPRYLRLAAHIALNPSASAICSYLSSRAGRSIRRTVRRIAHLGLGRPA